MFKLCAHVASLLLLVSVATASAVPTEQKMGTPETNPVPELEKLAPENPNISGTARQDNFGEEIDPETVPDDESEDDSQADTEIVECYFDDEAQSYLPALDDSQVESATFCKVSADGTSMELLDDSDDLDASV